MANRVLAALIGAVIFLGILNLQGCTVSSLTKGQPGKDISTLKPSLSRSEAEAILGPPLREWTTPMNIRYRIYRYDAGVPPSGTGESVAFVAFMDVITLGLFEFYEATGVTDLTKPSKDSSMRVWRQIAIAYDANERIEGLFDNFGDLDVLPADGHPVSR